jgi:hypothetical protein
MRPMRAASRYKRCRARARVRKAAFLVCCGAITTGHAQAQTNPSQSALHACFAWTSNQAHGCPTEAAIRAAVEGILGHPTFIGDRCDLWVSGTTRTTLRHATEIEVTFRSQEGSSFGQRRLEGNNPNCSAYTGPVALVVALMIESVQLDATFAESPAPTMAATSAPTRSRGSTGPAANEARSTEKARSPLAIAADARGAWGLLPQANVGVGAALEVSARGWLPWRVESALWLPSQSEQLGPGGRFWAWQAGVGIYPFTHDGLVRTQLLTGLDWGFMYGTGTGVDFTQSARRPFGEFALRVANSFGLVGPFDVVAQAGLAVPWLRPSFVYLDPSGSAVYVHRPERVLVEAGVGLAWRLGARSEQREPAR